MPVPKEPPKEIQLRGTELKKMHTLTKRVERDLLKLAHDVLAHLYGESRPRSLRSLHVIPNNTKTGVYDEQMNLVGIWEDPPGVCRAARPGETVD